MPKSLKEIDLAYFTDEVIMEAAAQVLEEYTALGGNGKVAKGPELTEKLKGLISSVEKSAV